AGHASFTKKVTGTEHCDDGFFAGPIHHRQFHSALLDVHHSLCGVTLREDRLASAIVLNLSRRSRGIEKGLCVESVESSIIPCFPGFHIRLKRPAPWCVQDQSHPNKFAFIKLYKTEQRAARHVPRMGTRWRE